MDIFFEIKNDNLEFLKVFLDSDNDPNDTIKINKSILSQEFFNDELPLISVASYFGSISCIKVLQEKNADINIVSQNKYMFTPIHFAIVGNQKECFDYFIQNHALTKGILFSSILFQNQPFFNYIIENNLDNVNYSDKFIENPLVQALKQKSIIMARKLLENNATFNNTLLEEYSSDKEIKELLLSFQKQNENRIEGVSTPLHIAADQNNINEARRIINEKKIDINAVTPNGDTALMKAAHRGALDIVKLLIEQPAVNINHANNGGIYF